jgi:hypothetical protein
MMMMRWVAEGRMPSSSCSSRLLVTAPFAGILLAGVGCGGYPARPCSTEPRSAILVTVLDAATGTPLCNTTVIVRDGAFSAILGTLPPSEPGRCVHSGAPERAGTYTVDVSARGKTSSVSNVKVERDECGHVMTQHVTVILDLGPASDDAPQLPESDSR